ncbi:MAG: hypothetical protein KAI63_01735, partial [Planctomycetes bacterium]|nr:hypothetical protein [Planctomycetota bacterium]
TVNKYDDRGRLTKVTDSKYSPAKIIKYRYYENGLRKKLIDPEGDTIKYTYDKAGRLKKVKKNGTLEAKYKYNALGLRKKLTRGNGSYTENVFDPVTRWLTGVFNRKSDGNTISSFIYDHDNVGNRLSMLLANGEYVDYDYDNIYQLERETRNRSNNSIIYDLQFDYDEVGNRIQQIRDIRGGARPKPTPPKGKGKPPAPPGKPDFSDLPGISTIDYVYNNANQLLEEQITRDITTRINKYTYDANGNQTEVIKNFGHAQQKTFAWEYDFENRQVIYNDPVNTNDATYAYNAAGTRIAKDVNGTIEKYIHDGANVIVDYDGSNNVKASYVTPFLDQNLLVTKNQQPTPNNYYYLADGLGSIRELIDSSENTKNSYDYYAFGAALNWSETVENRYTFTAR